MKISFKAIKSFLFLLLSLTVCHTANSSEAQAIVFSSPLKQLSPSELYIKSVLAEALSRHNLTFQTRYIPPQRSLRWIDNEQIDGELIRVKNFKELNPQGARNLIRLEHPFLTAIFYAYTTKNLVIRNWQSLSGLTVHYVRGLKIFEVKLSQVKPAVQENTANTHRQALRILAAKRTDAILGDSVIIDKLISESSEFNEVRFKHPLEKIEYYAHFHKKHKNLALLVVKTIKEMEREGRLEVIKKRYFE